MSTARKIIESALGHLGVKGTGRPLSAEDVRDGLEMLNDLLAEWQIGGILKQVSPVSSAGDELHEPEYARAALKTNLALRMAPMYGVSLNPLLAAQAGQATSSLKATHKPSLELKPSSLLPRGTAQAGRSNFYYEQTEDNF